MRFFGCQSCQDGRLFERGILGTSEHWREAPGFDLLELGEELVETAQQDRSDKWRAHVFDLDHDPALSGCSERDGSHRDEDVCARLADDGLSRGSPFRDGDARMKQIAQRQEGQLIAIVYDDYRVLVQSLLNVARL